jgi:hypothetical protein
MPNLEEDYRIWPSIVRRETEQSLSSMYVSSCQGKRVQENAGCKTKTAAKVWEENRKRELERAHAELPTRLKAKRISTVAEMIHLYLNA